MADKKRGIFLGDRAMSILRQGDTLSGRVTQVIDRYLQIMDAYGPTVRLQFTDAQWRTLHGDCAGMTKWPIAMVAQVMSRDGRLDHELQRKLNSLSPIETLVLVELLERD